MEKQLISDQDLIKGYLHGNEACLEQLIARHKRKIFSSIYHMVKDKYLAEDIFQDTFVKVIDTLHKGKYNEEGKFLPWAARIAHNLVIDHFRKQKRAPMVSTTSEDFDIFDILGQHDPGIEDEMLIQQSHKDLRKLITQLPKEQKEVLILRHYANLSFKEISEMTGVSINTALGRMRYALNNLRKIIETNRVYLKVS